MINKKLGIAGLLVLIIYFIMLLKIIPADHKVNQLIFNQSDFAKLPGWKHDQYKDAFIAFKYSCAEILSRPPKSSFANINFYGTNEAWQAICHQLTTLKEPDDRVARQFFEKWFVPFALYQDNVNKGRFTGYYLPLLHASFIKDAVYRFPIYGLPRDLVKVVLSQFTPNLKNKILIGQLRGQNLVPYPERQSINHGAIEKVTPVLLWGDNPIDIFFAQIQGSALVSLPNGNRQLLGYAGQNGRAYTPIGKVLITEYGFNPKSISMQSIRQWLVQHPHARDQLMNRNASYVFFQFLVTGPLGTEQVPLTPGRSLAVDSRFLPLGAPIWLSTMLPSNEKYQRLMVAQDTGGSIKGIIRGDIYFGVGEEAAKTAGVLNAEGRLWVLVPRKVTT